MYVYMYKGFNSAIVYIYIYTCTYTCMYMYIYTCIHVHGFTKISIDLYMCVISLQIVGGANMDNDDVIRQLQSQIDEPFKAQQVHSKGDKLMFFIEESRAANEMKRLGDSAIVVKPSPPPRGIGGGGGGGRGGGGERGGGSWGKGGSGGWQNDSQGDRRVTVQRRESDMMEEDPTAVLLVCYVCTLP